MNKISSLFDVIFSLIFFSAMFISSFFLLFLIIISIDFNNLTNDFYVIIYMLPIFIISSLLLNLSHAFFKYKLSILRGCCNNLYFLDGFFTKVELYIPNERAINLPFIDKKNGFFSVIFYITIFLSISLPAFIFGYKEILDSVITGLKYAKHLSSADSEIMAQDYIEYLSRVDIQSFQDLLTKIKYSNSFSIFIFSSVMMLISLSVVFVFAFMSSDGMERFKLFTKNNPTVLELIYVKLSLFIFPYLLIGLIFSGCWIYIYNTDPTSLKINSTEFGITDALYFSFVNMSTLGYGDITPVTGIAKWVSIWQTIYGVFYMAIVVGVTVGYVLSTTKQENTSDKKSNINIIRKRIERNRKK